VISDLVLCDLCAAANDAWAAGTWGAYGAGDCHLYRTDQDGYTILAAAGSEQLEDWVVDLMAGWRTDAAKVFPVLLDAQKTFLPLVLCGHSKGGADIIDVADRLRKAGIVAVRLVTFEAPIAGAHPGLRPMIPGADYAHHGDGVPMVPLGVRRPQPLTWFPDPALIDYDDLFANHHLATAVRPALVRFLGAAP
jgi:alpha-beta hydrolase superfamily lysophospholipase